MTNLREKNSKRKILLIEDDELIVEIYTAQFKKAGFSIESASDGEKAFKKLKENKYDLLLLDIVLPNLTGFELLKRIKNNKEINKAKILILSNLGQKTDVERAENLGAIKYLIKAHYTPSEVVQEVIEILK